MASDNFLRFPSGRSVGNCRRDAKKLKKNGLTYTQALDVIAEQNGLSGGWDKAIKHLQSTKSHTLATSWLSSMIGTHKQTVSKVKKELIASSSDENSDIWLPDGEGEVVRVFPHRKSGVLITEQAAKLLEKDISAITELGNGVELLYEVPDSDCHMAYSIMVAGDGSIFHFCRCLPVTYEADFYAQDLRVREVGSGGYRPADSMLHWTSFCFWYPMLKLKVY